ncbi:hypothetical protein [Rhizobium oryzihabitans]|uniref:hypothetical protein n=1 Tax=Rhizobium oryzihabitans TaxID=2267833 RepID=UPI001FE2D5D6|nr:hypothetical protein [Rhizobium oryzihabitans]
MFHPRNIVGSTALTSPVTLRAKTRDNFTTFDRATIDSAGAFLVGELERLDQTLNQPLVNYTWSRDIDLREDVQIGDELASFTNSSFAAPGGITPTGKNWISKSANAISTIQIDIGKTPSLCTSGAWNFPGPSRSSKAPPSLAVRSTRRNTMP